MEGDVGEEVVAERDEGGRQGGRLVRKVVGQAHVVRDGHHAGGHLVGGAIQCCRPENVTEIIVASTS